jgi:hypothetical protein
MIKIQVKQYFIDSGEIFSDTIKKFETDKQSIDYLKEVENNKMQTITDSLKKGIYKPSLIVKNAKSQYGIQFVCKDGLEVGLKPVNKKPLYNEFVKANNIKTVITIN